jgi:LPXTG-motif cell wall-anchored protein
MLDPADIGTGRDLSGFEFTVSAVADVADTGTVAGDTGTVAGGDADNADDVVVRTDASGTTPTIELPVGRYRVVEQATPDWAADLVDGGPIEVDVDASDTVVEAVYTNAEPVASITTAARDGADGDQMIDLTQGDATVIDSVAYRGLVPGTEYVAVGELMRRTDPPSADGAAADGGDDADAGGGGVDSAGVAMAPTGVVGSTTFVAEASSGTVDVSFVVPADSPLLGHAVVVFQRIEVRSSARVVATHHDATSVEQTVWLPFMSTTLMADSTTGHGDGQSDHVDDTAVTPVAPGDALVDLVAVFGLRPDRRYRSDLTLHRRLDDGTCVATDRTASTTVDATASVGDEPTTFAVRGVTAPEPGVYVAFQVLSLLGDDGGEHVVARHADCDSVSQRVEVVAPPVTSTTTTTTAPTATVPATTGPTTTATAVIHPSTSMAKAHPTTTVSPRPLPRTGTDVGTTLAVAGLALLLVGVGISSLVRRPRDPHARNPHARNPHGRRPSV